MIEAVASVLAGLWCGVGLPGLMAIYVLGSSAGLCIAGLVASRLRDGTTATQRPGQARSDRIGCSYRILSGYRIAIRYNSLQAGQPRLNMQGSRRLHKT